MNRPNILSRNAFGALLICMLGISLLAQAQQQSSRYKSTRWTVAEVASLPQYCQDRFNNKRNMERWERDFGPDIYLHLHHFCAALIYFSRASTEFDVKRRNRAAIDGIGNFNYVLKRWPASFSLYQQAQIYKTQLEMIRDFK